MRTKTVTQSSVLFSEKVLADLKAENPKFKPNEHTLSLLRGFDDVMAGRLHVLRRPTK